LLTASASEPAGVSGIKAAALNSVFVFVIINLKAILSRLDYRRKFIEKSFEIVG
jgi:hypothetical protein